MNLFILSLTLSLLLVVVVIIVTIRVLMMIIIIIAIIITMAIIIITVIISRKDYRGKAGAPLYATTTVHVCLSVCVEVNVRRTRNR